MTVRLRLISGEDDDFFRDIEISSESTFLELHNFIQQLLNFEEGQMASFFITDAEWHKNEEITLMDMALDESSDSNIMAETKIGQYITENKQRLIYVFDFFNERNLFIESFDITNTECHKTQCINSAGEPPRQLDLNDILGEGSQEENLMSNDYDIDEYLDHPDSDFDSDSMISYTDDLEDL
ncbi:IS1096 element passenger TnpR family protein [Plebeiibacterium marinum]|uniref:Plasmid pRiA4b ORF-3 family protein n=1 Tax=Plebeiibacterium marinum TaxID=2992111 RepID=A0AAE3SLF4_9BACT|nr:hypothetical protein [Plebeiobacterium marinum]MCW3807830.1 plasmid pRiA4b ORF-3 family protein [Plebeiobacterium marinum]